MEGEAFRCFDFPFSVSSSLSADGVLSRDVEDLSIQDELMNTIHIILSHRL